jgi:predicted kinase
MKLAAPPVVLVTGVPGAGKSTLAHRLAGTLYGVLLSLDETKETLYSQGIHIDDRAALRFAAERDLARRAAAEPRTVVLDIWGAPGRDEERTRGWIGRLERAVVEVLCRVPPAVAVERYRSRHRTGPHLPADDETLRRIEAAADVIAPLVLGAVIEVDTSGLVDVARLVARIVAAADSARASAPDG